MDACRGALVVVGHCRWATHGRPEDNRNNHPHPAGRGWLVHNGVVLNYANLLRRYRLVPRTQCDSEILGLLMARLAGNLADRVARRGNPLCFGETAGGIYFASLPEELPGPVTAIRDNYSGVLAYHDGDLLHVARPIGN